MNTAYTLRFGVLLKRYRNAAGLTQEELAERAGLSVEGISALERAVNRAPRKDTIQLLADALALSDEERVTLATAARQRSLSVEAPSNTNGAASASADATPLAGRARELDLLQRHLSGASRPLLLLTGEPGVGKTRLLREAAARGAAEGWTVLLGTCQRRASQDPYAPLLGALEQHIHQLSPGRRRSALQDCGWLARLLPELAATVRPPTLSWSLPPEQERRLMFLAVARYLANVAGAAGTLLVLDDLQWAGADGIDLLNALLQMPSLASLRIVGAFRDTEVPPDSILATAVADLARGGYLAQHSLAPLSASAATELIQTLLPKRDAAHDLVSEQVLARAGGIPFFLVSCAQAIQAGALDGFSLASVPWDVEQSIRQRVLVLPEAAQRMVHAAAVAGHDLSRSVLFTLAARPDQGEDELLAALEAACAARILVESGDDHYHIAHDLVRDVIARDLSAARRATLHRRLAETLERGPGETPAELLAYHFTHGGERARAIIYLERAGDRALRMRAHAGAETAYREVVERLDEMNQPTEAAHAREKLAETLRTMACYEQALAVLDQAIATYRATGDQESLARATAGLGQLHADQGTAREGVACLEPVIASAEAGAVSPHVRAALFDAVAQLQHIQGLYEDQLRSAQQAVELARQASDSRLLAQVQMREGNALRMLGRLGEATQVVEEAIALAEASGDLRTVAYALENVSVVYLLRGEFDRAQRNVERALTLTEQLGDAISIELMVLRRGMNAFVMGAWQQARADFERAAEAMRQVGTSWVSAYTCVGLGQICIAQGEWEAADHYLRESIALAVQSGDLQALRWAQSAAAERDILEGKPHAARQRLTPLQDRAGEEEGLVTYLLPYLAWAHLATGDIGQAEALIQTSVMRATREHIRLALVDALRVRALLAMHGHAWQTAQDDLEAALTLTQSIRFPYGEAKVLYAQALLQLAQQRGEQARRPLECARDLLAGLGERLYAERVERALTDLR